MLKDKIKKKSIIQKDPNTKKKIKEMRTKFKINNK
jgi:hypothetical protein